MFFSARFREWSWKENTNQEKRFAHSFKEKVEIEFDESADAKGWRVYNIYRDCIRKLRQHLRARGLPQRIPMGPDPQRRDGERVRHRQGWQQIRAPPGTEAEDTTIIGCWKTGRGEDAHGEVVHPHLVNNSLRSLKMRRLISRPCPIGLEIFHIFNFDYLLLFILGKIEI